MSVTSAPVSRGSTELDLPRMQTGGSPQHLVLTLLGDYWSRRRAPLPSAAVVALLGEFGVTEVSARAAVSRLARRGLLDLSKVGRHTSYVLSDRAAEVLSEDIRHIRSFGAEDPVWSGRWTVVAFSVPEDQRELRHTLRTRLGWLGFAPLFDGLWVSAHERAAEVTAVMAELAIGTATVLRSEVAEGSPPGGHPITAWDLDAVRDAYRQLLVDYEPVAGRLRSGLVGPAEALVARTALIDAWRRLPGLDPQLPAELLPPRWPRARARALFIELYDGLAWLAERRVVQVVTEFDPDLGGLVQSHRSDIPPTP